MFVRLRLSDTGLLLDGNQLPCEWLACARLNKRKQHREGGGTGRVPGTGKIRLCHARSLQKREPKGRKRVEGGPSTSCPHNVWQVLCGRRVGGSSACTQNHSNTSSTSPHKSLIQQHLSLAELDAADLPARLKSSTQPCWTARPQPGTGDPTWLQLLLAPSDTRRIPQERSKTDSIQ